MKKQDLEMEFPDDPEAANKMVEIGDGQTVPEIIYTYEK